MTIATNDFSLTAAAEMLMPVGRGEAESKYPTPGYMYPPTARIMNPKIKNQESGTQSMAYFDAKAWANKPTSTPTHLNDDNPRGSLADCKAAMEASGLIFTGPVVGDGEFQRVRHQASKRSKDSGWYVVNITDNGIIYANFGAWNVGDSSEWCSKAPSKFTPIDTAAIERHRAEVKRQREAKQELAALEARSTIAAAGDADPNHPYFVDKGIKPHGIYQNGDELLVAARQADGTISTYQRILKNGKKFFMVDGKAAGASFMFPGSTEVIYIGEGVANVATNYEALSEGPQCYAAFSAENLLAVALAVSKQYPTAEIIITGDDDRWTEGNPGRTKATAAAKAVGGRAVFPEFTDLTEKPTDFNDMAKARGQEGVQAILTAATDKSCEPLSARTYDDTFDPARLAVRAWIIFGLLLRGYVTAVLAPPGVGKSLFALVIAIMVATGRSILSKGQREVTNVLYINNEDDQDEIDRRVAGICQQHQIPFNELNGKLFTLSGYGNPIIIAHKEGKETVVAHPDAERVTSFCNAHNIGTIILDPFISTHDVPENDNTDVDKVVQKYRAIAKATGAAIILVHHTRKTGADSESHAGDEQSGRGAYSLVAATRIAFTLARMSKDSATGFGIDWERGNRLIRMDDGKMNFALKDDKADWYELVSVEIGNGDSVGVPVPFDMNDIAKQIEEEKAQEKTENNKAKITEIARDVATVMTADEQPQGEVRAAYRAHTDKGKTAVNDSLALLPVRRINAVRIMVRGNAVRVWRVNTGSNSAPRYTIHKEAEE